MPELPPLDAWICGVLGRLVIDTTQRLESYDLTGAARGISDFCRHPVELVHPAARASGSGQALISPAARSAATSSAISARRIRRCGAAW